MPQSNGTYSIVEVGNSCNHESEPFEYLAGIESENNGLKLSVFPNPTQNGNLNIAISSDSTHPVEITLTRGSLE
jgi:hypothetical protein